MPSRRTLAPALALAALLAAGPPAGAAPKPPHVTYSGWTVTTGGRQVHVRPNGTLRSCTAPTEMIAVGRVVRAVKGQRYVDTFTHGSKRVARYVDTWAGSGAYADSWGFFAHGFTNGTWRTKLTRGKTTIGTESITIRCSA